MLKLRLLMWRSAWTCCIFDDHSLHGQGLVAILVNRLRLVLRVWNGGGKWVAATREVWYCSIIFHVNITECSFFYFKGIASNGHLRVKCISVYFLILCLCRALLEGERVGLQDAQRRMNQHQRERVIGTVAPEICYCDIWHSSGAGSEDKHYTKIGFLKYIVFWLPTCSHVSQIDCILFGKVAGEDDAAYHWL